MSRMALSRCVTRASGGDNTDRGCGGVRNIDRLLDRGHGRIRRRDRPQFERFLDHRNERLRRYAGEIDRWLRRQAEEFREALRADEEAVEAMAKDLDANQSGAPAGPR